MCIRDRLLDLLGLANGGLGNTRRQVAHDRQVVDRVQALAELGVVGQVRVDRQHVAAIITFDHRRAGLEVDVRDAGERRGPTAGGRHLQRPDHVDVGAGLFWHCLLYTSRCV